MQNNCVGNFIAQKRKAAGLTQKQLAEKLNISFQAISKWEKGMAMPGSDVLIKLANELQVNVEDILNGKDSNCVSYRKQVLIFHILIL